MSNYRKTMTEALQEMKPLNERMRMGRQLIDTNKEVMIVKKNKVIVIDKKDQDKYMKQGWELAEEVNLDESVIDKVKEIDRKKSAKKIDGVMVDSFTASAISQVYDKVNDKNKKRMEKLPIKKLADLAMKFIKHGEEFVPEEVDLDEGKMQDMWQKKNAQSLSVGPFELLRGKSGVHTIKRSGKVLGDFSYDSDADNFVANMKGMRGQWTGNDIDSLFTHLQKVHKEEVEIDEAFKKGDKVTINVAKSSEPEMQRLRKELGDTISGIVMGQSGRILMVKTAKGQVNPHVKDVMKEEVELDESEFSAMAYGKKDQRFIVKPRDTKGMKGKQDKFKMYVVKLDNKGNEREIIKDLGTHVSIDRAIGFAKNKKIIEDVELDEKVKEYKGVAYFKDRKDAEAHMKKYAPKGRIREYDRGYAIQTKIAGPYLNKSGKTEEVDLDEGKMKDLVIKGQDLEMYAKKSGGIDKNDMMKVAAMLKKGNKSGAVKYAMKLDTDPKEYILNLIGEEVEVEESKTTVPMSKKVGQSVKKGQVPKGMYGNAARDARRAMGRDPEMRQRPFSKDDSATDDDVKGASKNIMMQMRKAQSLNGRFDVEFADGKKVKIPAKMAIAVQSKYNKMRRPAEKEKFQAKIAKSYRDMLSALKEAVSPAQQAAIAISKKERGEKPKKESVLDRIDRKIKEKNDG